LRRPKSTDFDAAGRQRYARYMETKLDRELRIFARVAADYDRLGPWGKGSRATAYLSEKDLAQFETEYLDLINRYAHRHGSVGHGGDHILPAFVSPSLTLPVLASARDLYLHIEGPEKKQVFSRIVKDEGAWPRNPLRALMQHASAPLVVYWCD